MTPLFSPSAPWATRVLLLTCMFSLPIAGLVIREILQHQRLKPQIAQVTKILADREIMLRQQQEAHQRRMRHSHQLEAVPLAIRLMDSVASVLSPEISLLSIDIDATARDVRLSVNVISLKSLLTFSERLQKLPAHVKLENHRPATDNVPGWPLNASLEVHFNAEVNHATGR